MMLLRFLTILAACLLVSCIDGREEFWLNADGSGRAEVAYSLPAAAAKFQGGEAGVRALIDGFLKGSPVLTASSCEVTTSGDRLEIRVRAAFDSALDLKELSQGGSLEKLPSSAAGLAGTVKVERRGLGIDFSRTITASKALPGAAFMPESRFAGRNLTYIVHLPEAAGASNATRVADGGRTLVWEIPLAAALKGPITTRFRIPLPIPRWAVACGVAAVLLVGFRTWKLFRAKPVAA